MAKLMKKSKTLVHRDLEFVPDAVVVVDRHGNIAQVNTQAESMFGYRREELLGKPLEMLMPACYREEHVWHRTDYFSQPVQRPMGAGLELYGKRKDGTEFPVEISLSPLESAEGILVTAAIRNITTRKKAEAQLLQKMQELNRSRGDGEFISRKESP
jgi:protein-histidine pros-kinase